MATFCIQNSAARACPRPQLHGGSDTTMAFPDSGGRAHPDDGKRPVLGLDISVYQNVDFTTLGDWSDSDGRRVWFVGARVCDGGTADARFGDHWQALVRTRFLRIPYTFLRPLDRHRSKGATDAKLQELADARFEKFKEHYMSRGGFRPYDLPPGIDFEPSTPQTPNADEKQDAWTLLPVLRTFIRRMTAMFGTRPFLYSGKHFFRDWYGIAKQGMQQERPGLIWDDEWLSPIFQCRIWHSGYPYGANLARDPGGWPWDKPPHYAGTHPWFSTGAPWDIWQWGIAREHGVLPPASPTLVHPPANPTPQESQSATWNALPDTDAQSFGISRTSGGNPRVDLDVWNGSLEELVAVAVQTRFDPKA